MNDTLEDSLLSSPQVTTHIQDAPVAGRLRWVMQEKFFTVRFCGLSKMPQGRYVKLQESGEVSFLTNAKQLQTPIPQSGLT